MKRLSIIVISVLAMVFGLTSCGNGPETAAENFYNSIQKGQFEQAKLYCTESTAELVDLMKAFGSLSKLDPTFEVKAVRDSVEGNYAWVWVINEKGEEEKVDLMKVDGEWLVSITK